MIKGMRRASPIILGLIVGNVFYQALTAQDWWVAGERSWFQLVACVGTAWYLATDN